MLGFLIFPYYQKIISIAINDFVNLFKGGAEFCDFRYVIRKYIRDYIRDFV